VDLEFAIDRMHFILEKPALDELHEEGPVTVGDLPQMRVLSIAYQGRLTSDEVQQADRSLREHLQTHTNIRASGPVRVLGYNSPFVPADKAYWEIQVPIEAVE
jgi:hypothetical protein